MSRHLPETVVFVPPASGRLGDHVLFASLKCDLAKRRSQTQMTFLPLEAALQKSSWEQPTRFMIGFFPAASDIQLGQELIGRLLSLGISKKNIWSVLWQSEMAGGLSAETLKQIGVIFDIVLPIDPPLLLKCENRGELLKSRPISNLAEKMADWFKKAADTPASIDWQNVEKRIIAHVWDGLGTGLDRRMISTEEMTSRVDESLRRFLSEGEIPTGSESVLSSLRQRVFDHVTGLGPLEPLLRDASINEIMVNGLEGIFVERDGAIEKTAVFFESDLQLRTVIDRAVAKVGRRVDLASPLCDLRLPDGSRVNVVLPPLSLSGPLMTIRRFRSLYKSMDDLIRAGTLNEQQASRLATAIEERSNILIAGNSGAGKTTLLNVLAGLISPHERIITIEDAAELQIDQPHVVRLETRAANAEDKGEIGVADLLINALRMRPDRLIIGECRGREVVPMLQAMNTGHDGSLTTIHANSAADALKRLESLVLLQAPEWPVSVVRDQIVAGLDLVVYVKRDGSGRKVMEIMDV